MRSTPKLSTKFPQKSQNSIQKSVSSTSFKKMFSKQDEFGDGIDYDDDEEENLEFYINAGDDLDPNNYESNSDLSDEEHYVNTNVKASQEQPISNTRYNKTFLMRVEQSKKASGGANAKGAGVMACPNTPELPRRDMTIRASFRDRSSMPRDSSLNRMKRDLVAASAQLQANTNKKSNLIGSNSCPPTQSKDNKKVLPKYLDISKYKAEKGNTFLKRDETKSYLAREVKKSSSSACLQNAANFQRVDTTRTSSRSIKSAGSRPNSSTKKDPGE